MHLLKNAKKQDQVTEENLIEYTATIVSAQHVLGALIECETHPGDGQFTVN